MAVGDPDKPTPSHILQVMHEAIDEAANHNYPPLVSAESKKHSALVITHYSLLITHYSLLS
jgi:LL-diaminopimelate aminotransferase